MKKITKPKNTKTTKTAKKAKPPAKTTPAKIKKDKMKRVPVVQIAQKDIPLHNLIDQVVVIYLKELVMNYQVAFKGDRYVEAMRNSGTGALHGEFYDGCTRYAALNEALRAMQKAQAAALVPEELTKEVVQQAEIIFAQVRESNLEQLEKLEQLSLVMRPGQAWRKELDAVGLGNNAKRWLALWDESLPKIQALKKKGMGKK